MRLLNTRTFELEDFGVQSPPYTILSHTWGEEEVTFQDMSDLDAARNKKGFAKVERAVGKTSSTALNEPGSTRAASTRH